MSRSGSLPRTGQRWPSLGAMRNTSRNRGRQGESACLN